MFFIEYKQTNIVDESMHSEMIQSNQKVKLFESIELAKSYIEHEINTQHKAGINWIYNDGSGGFTGYYARINDNDVNYIIHETE